MPTAANRPAHLLQGVERIRALAERADRNAIDRLLTHPAATSRLDARTLDFLRRAQDLLLATTHALTEAAGVPTTAAREHVTPAARRTSQMRQAAVV